MYPSDLQSSFEETVLRLVLSDPMVVQALLLRLAQGQQDTTPPRPTLLPPAVFWEYAVRYGLAPFLGAPDPAFAHVPLYGHPSQLFAGDSMDMLVSRMEGATLSPDGPPPHVGRPGHIESPRHCPSISGAPADPQSFLPPAPQLYAADEEPTSHFGVWENYWETSGTCRGVLPSGEPPPPIQVVPQRVLSSFPTFPSPPSFPPSFEPVDQVEYQGKQPVRGTPAGPIFFNDGNGVPLGDLGLLLDGDDDAFDPAASLGMKASVRFGLAQYPARISTQVRVRHGEGKGHKSTTPYSKREIAALVKTELEKLVGHAGDLVHKNLRVKVDDIILVQINHVSKGSIQPILAVRN